MTLNAKQALEIAELLDLAKQKYGLSYEDFDIDWNNELFHVIISTIKSRLNAIETYEKELRGENEPDDHFYVTSLTDRTDMAVEMLRAGDQGHTLVIESLMTIDGEKTSVVGEYKFVAVSLHEVTLTLGETTIKRKIELDDIESLTVLEG